MIIKKNKIKHWEDTTQERQPKEQAAVSDVNIVDTSVKDSTDIVNNEEMNQNESIQPQEQEIDLFDVENIDFNQRAERRRGTRRRGYRRIDDRNLVSRAQEEAENIKKSAFEEGYRRGLEQANSDIEQFRGNFKQFIGAPKEVFEYIAPDILEISIDIAKKIIKKEVESDPQVLIETIMDVLKTVSKNEPKVNIRVKPQAAAFVKDTLPTVTYQYGIDAKINIIADPSIEDGGCIFQTNNGIVDASVDTQLEIIKKALMGI